MSNTPPRGIFHPNGTVGTDLVSVRVGKLLADGHKVRPYRMYA
jgi:hypothetical protein